MRSIHFITIAITITSEILLTTSLFEIIFGDGLGALVIIFLLGAGILVSLLVYFVNFYFFQKKMQNDKSINLNTYITLNIFFLCIFIILPLVGFPYLETNPIFDDIFIIPSILIVAMFLWVNNRLIKILKNKN